MEMGHPFCMLTLNDYTLKLNCLSVPNPSYISLWSFSNREITMWGKSKYALSVGKGSSRYLSSLIIREFLLERKVMGAVCVGKPSPESPDSLNIREFFQD